MATRTAGTVDGTGDFTTVSVKYIDYTGSLRSDSYLVPAGATNAQIEALIAALQAGSNASIYRVDVAQVYNGDRDSGNADEVVWEDVKDNLVIQFRNSVMDTKDIFVPSPFNGMFIEGTENIDPADTALADIITAGLAVFGAGYNALGARFSKRRRRGRQVRF